MEYSMLAHPLKQSPDVAMIIRLEGELSQGMKFENLTKELMDQPLENRKHVIFDMEDVYYINSSGLGALIAIYHSVRGKTESFAVVNLQPQVARIMLNFQLFNLLKYFDSWETAVDSLN